VNATTLRARTLVVVVAGLVALGGCAGRDGTDPPAGPAATSSSTPPVERWLAVMEVAPLADDLSETTERVRDRLGLALIVSPVDCIEGLPPELRDGYVLGAIGDSAHEVEQLVAEAGEQAMVTTHVTIVCTD
jgi:hypothetical protein